MSKVKFLLARIKQKLNHTEDTSHDFEDITMENILHSQKQNSTDKATALSYISVAYMTQEQNKQEGKEQIITKMFQSK